MNTDNATNPTNRPATEVDEADIMVHSSATSTTLEPTGLALNHVRDSSTISESTTSRSEVQAVRGLAKEMDEQERTAKERERKSREEAATTTPPRQRSPFPTEKFRRSPLPAPSPSVSTEGTTSSTPRTRKAFPEDKFGGRAVTSAATATNNPYIAVTVGAFQDPTPLVSPVESSIARPTEVTVTENQRNNSDDGDDDDGDDDDPEMQTELLEATLVDGDGADEKPLVTAEPAPEGSTMWRFLKTTGGKLLCFGVCLVIGIVAIAVPAIVTSASAAESDGSAIMATSSATAMPTSSTAMPIEDHELTALLPDYTISSLQNLTSPQRQAFNWLAEHPAFDSLEDWRKLQVYALATIYYSFQGESWPVPFLSYDLNECLWVGTRGSTPKCSADRVTRIELGGIGPDYKFDLRGTMPPEVSLLSSLEELQVVHSTLAVNLSDIVPTHLANLVNLRDLDFNDNGLVGTIPAVIGNLNLRFFEAGNNALAGTLFTELGLLQSLTWFRTYGNFLEGPIPSELGQISVLWNLDMAGNQHTGHIPSEIGELKQLTYSLNLGANSLRGNIPSELGGLVSLTGLYLSDNFLSGPIPTELGLALMLKDVNIGGNILREHIPSELGMLNGLTNLNIGTNSLSRNLPSELGQLEFLQELYLDNNFLTGPIPSELGMLNGLTKLNIGTNALSGNLPSELGQLEFLQELYLDNNRLTGPIPSELGQATSIRTIYLHSMWLSGTIPSQLGLLQDLAWVGIYQNNLSGSVPEEVCSLENLEFFGVDCKKVACNDPNATCDCKCDVW